MTVPRSTGRARLEVGVAWKERRSLDVAGGWLHDSPKGHADLNVDTYRSIEIWSVLRGRAGGEAARDG